MSANFKTMAELMETHDAAQVRPLKRGRKAGVGNKSHPTSKNVTLDLDILELFDEAKGTFLKVFHFEPTISQVVRYAMVETIKRLKADAEGEPRQ